MEDEVPKDIDDHLMRCDPSPVLNERDMCNRYKQYSLLKQFCNLCRMRELKGVGAHNSLSKVMASYGVLSSTISLGTAKPGKVATCTYNTNIGASIELLVELSLLLDDGHHLLRRGILRKEINEHRK